MRKLQQVALVVAAAGGLSTIGSGVSSATPVGYGAAPPPVPQQDPQASAWSGSQATSSASGSYAYPQQAAPQDAPQVNPQINPQLSPQLSPEISPQATPAQQDQNNLFRPFQECSPAALLDADLPVSLLAASQTRGVTCHQHNHQANAFATASGH
ncbi:hypothetical protein [Streptomyces halobius]|uniref:Uncharacterized protein n=1 Tax=Streptomyces halobius TaxID=2879846 RepID=A0ABY4MD55_9ACTN|nr:hypothetical protein [Streptomyces halobius]UQA95038.1 hypothetical protein K9S39_27120 [Streptomyces halobius]